MPTDLLTHTFGLWNCDRKLRPTVLACMQWINQNGGRRWQYRLLDTGDIKLIEDKLDLLIIFDHTENFDTTRALRYAKALLFVGNYPIASHAHVPEINTDTQHLVSQTLDVISQRLLLTSVSDTGSVASTNYARSAINSTTRTYYKLKRWPPHVLIRDPHYVKLATLLTARPFKIDELSKKSSIPQHICNQFIQTLESNQCFTDTNFDSADLTTPAKPSSSARAIKPGLFGLIRQRLGI